jgi:alpha-D-xyloside xylohydrolase
LWLWPDHATFPSGTSGEQMRQGYALLLQRLVADMYHRRDLRTFGLSRGSNAGSASLPFALYSDYYDHRDFVTALCNASFCGLLWAPEARRADSAEEWVRRMQLACFAPIAQLNAWAHGTKPWSFPEGWQAVREVAMLRMRLIPYLYTAFARYYFDGTPPFRAMVLERGFPPTVDQGVLHTDTAETEYYPVEAAPEVKDQYMVGDALLVAPMFAGQVERTVVLPRGNWFDFYSGEAAGNGETIAVRPGLDTIPLYVRDGGIIPLMPARLRAPRSGEVVPLEVRHYGHVEGRFMLYDDDGETFAYERGAYRWRELTVTREDSGALVGAVSPIEESWPFTYGPISWRFMSR